jgi:hypothetical protein
VDPDAEAERINFGVGGLALPQLSLDFNGASDGVDGAREFYQRAVTHELDDAAGMSGNRRIDQTTP